MKKEDAYRDKSGCYVAFEYNGHVFVLKTIKGTANGKTWTNPRYAFCPISSDTEFAVRFTSVEEAIVAVKKIGLKVVYTQEWEVLENKNFNTSCVDKLKWKEWHEYQEVLRHAAPFAAIAVGNRVYKDTYSTALSDGNAWVFAAGAERLFGFPVRATHKIDQLLFAVRQYPDMKLFDTVEERTEWSLKYLEEYAAKPEPTPVAKEQEVEVAPHTHTVTAVLPATAPPNSTAELPPVGLTNVPRNSCIVHAFESQGTPKLRPVDIADEPEFACAAVVIGEKIFRSFPMDIIDQDGWKFLDVKTSQPLRMHQGIEFAEDLGSDITAPTLAGLIAAAEERGKELGFKVAKFTSEANYRRWIDDQWPKPKGTVTSVAVRADININGAGLCWTPTETARLTTDGPGSSWDVVDNNGMPHGVEAARKFLTHVTASSDAQPIIETDGIKTMKPGVTPQPSRSRIGKIAARPYEYVYDGPQQMGTTFVSRYRIDDEVWVRVSDKLVKMKVIDIYVSCKKWEVEYSYRLGNDTLTIHNRPAENQLYDTLFDLISAMTSISVEELIAAAKEVV